MKTSIIVIAALALSPLASASDYTGGIETFVCYTVHQSCQVRVTGKVNGETCAPDAHWQYAFNATTLAGKNVLSIITTAQIARKNVTIAGLNTCVLTNGESEDLRSIYINPQTETN